MFYKFVYVLFGMNEFEVFKVWLFFVGVMMVIGMYLVVRKFYLSWVGFWGVVLMMGF